MRGDSRRYTEHIGHNTCLNIHLFSDPMFKAYSVIFVNFVNACRSNMVFPLFRSFLTFTSKCPKERIQFVALRFI